MKHACKITAVLILALALAYGRGHAQENARIFIDGVKAYKNGEYATAVDCFTAIAESGIRNGSLYYNLANACFRAGDIGRAILWYEKARKLMPNDPDLAFNLAYAKSHVKDKQPDRSSVLRAIFFWRYMLSHDTLIWMAVVLNGLFFTALFVKRILKKKVPGLLTGVLFSLLVICATTVGFNFYAEQAFPEGVILPETVSVRSGVDDLSTELFVLHAGSRVDIQKRRQGYVRIRFGKDKTGWVKQEAVGVI
ncbi:MAG: tetratricopeptide repeat protein [Thermodesulfobacteriota bacterium]|nr:tetratricopeptide repeat protein [Thermodesulfobacteriota bacterium]